MWQAETFDPKTIDRELGMAEELGLNSVRVFLNYVVWKADPDGFKKRFSQFLEIADKHGISVMPIFFDDCAFAGKEPKLGKQDDPVPGVHNSGWVPSPGKSRVLDSTCWPDLEKYVKDIKQLTGRLKVSSEKSSFRGWNSQRLGNGLVELQIVPESGGRVIQLTMGNKDFLWVNPQLAGKLPPEGGVGPDNEWLNYGGDKLWPAPQGWDNAEQWPGPPDAVLVDGAGTDTGKIAEAVVD
jgi:hypothetical protein